MSGHAFAAAPPEGAAPAGPARRARLLAAPLAVAALGATAGAAWLAAASRHAPDPRGHALLAGVVCLSFVGAGLVALRRPPYVRFGLLLVAVGFASLLGSLHDGNDAVVYTAGVLTGNLAFAVLVHALLAFPSGRLWTRGNRILAVVAYLDVLALQAAAVLFDPLTRWKSDHPRNVALVAAHPRLATTLEELEAAVAVGLAVAVTAAIWRRSRSKTAVARRQLLPVLLGGKIALLLFSVGLVLAPLSTRAAVVGIGLGLLAALALPAAFLGMVVQGRLASAAVGELLVELREGTAPPDLQDALRRALGDPTLELLRHGPHGRRPLPGADDARVATPVRHHGAKVGLLVHDRSLSLRPELLDAVNAAAGFALANERALETVQQVEGRNRALLDAIPDLMFRVARDGTYLDVRADDPSGLLRPPDELVGLNARDVLPPDVADAVLACVERALETGRMSAVEYELTIGGVARCFESRMVPSGDGEVVTIVRDFTEQRRAQAEQRRLGEEQAALRRVATLVAGDAPPEQVFQVVTEEASELLGLRSALLVRYEDERAATVVGKYGDPHGHFELGDLLPLDDGAARRVLATGGAVRVDYGGVPGGIAARMREHGFRSAVGVPIAVAGATWGALIAALRDGETLPRETERRLEAFGELVAIALASAQARDELAASRLRIIEASDGERQRLERNLHDGAQQRLVALSVGLRVAQKKIREAPEEAEALLELTAAELSEALTELRELAQGLHPAVLTERGLPTALEVLAARAPLPVSLDLHLPERLPEPVEAAAYYVVSESLANVVKHAGAASAAVRVGRADGCIRVEVEDDGVGGAQLDGGSGLCGLRDRVETLAGRLEVASEAGSGTRVHAEIPLALP